MNGADPRRTTSDRGGKSARTCNARDAVRLCPILRTLSSVLSWATGGPSTVAWLRRTTIECSSVHRRPIGSAASVGSSAVVRIRVFGHASVVA